MNRKIIALILALTVALFFIPQKASAASLTAISDVMTRIKASTLSSHDISFTLGGSTALDASETVTIDFDEDGGKFVVSGAATVVADLDFNDGTERTIVDVDGSCVGHSGANDIVAQVNDTTGVLTFTACGSYTASGAGATINVEYGVAASGTDRVTNPGTGTVVIDVTAAGDTGKFAASIITDDQVVVSTTIDPYLTFTLTQNTVSLTKSGGGNPDYNNTGFNNGSANTLAANTNATNGYTISYQGATLSANAGADTVDAMATKTTSSTGTEQFGINLKDNTTPNTGAEPSGGSGAPASDYNTADQFRFIADTTTTLASAGGPTATTTFTATYIVNVAQVTEAGAYSTTITYIATGNF